jgi:hypothetical protein
VNIALETGEVLNGDLVPRLTLRYDLTPIPSTLECVIKADERICRDVKDGSILLAGRDKDRYKVIKAEIVSDSGQVARGEAEQLLKITAVLEACYPLIVKRQRAVIKENSTFSDIYRACGCSIRAKSDSQVRRFSCFVGDTASFQIARAMQEQAAVPIWKESEFTFLPVRNAIAQKPSMAIGLDKTKELKSGFLERHAVPGFISTGPAGEFIFGNREKARDIQYSPRKNEVVLRNMTVALVTRRTLEIGLNTLIYAGDVVAVEGKSHLVVTAVHARTGADEGENYYSQFWLATLEGAA